MAKTIDTLVEDIYALIDRGIDFETTTRGVVGEERGRALVLCPEGGGCGEDTPPSSPGSERTCGCTPVLGQSSDPTSSDLPGGERGNDGSDPSGNSDRVCVPSNASSESEKRLENFVRSLTATLRQRLDVNQRVRSRPLSLSSLGTPCERKLYYAQSSTHEGEPLSPAARLKFLFGDILEELLLFLAEEAGHTVEGRQDTLDVHGVVGHRDALIDGRLVDVKSASTYSYKKFADNGLRDDDPFGYLVQLNAYYHGSSGDARLTDRGVASFLVIDKTLGHICLDTYPMGEMDLETMVKEKRAMLAKPNPPPRAFTDVPDGKSGNKKLGVACSYCDYKKTCWPGLQTYFYSNGPTFLTKVEREPKVPKEQEAELRS